MASIASKIETRHYLGNSYVASEKSFPLINPFTGAQVTAVYEATKVEIDKAVELAKPAAEVWGEASAGERAAKLKKLAGLIRENAGELAELEKLSGLAAPVAPHLVEAGAKTLEWFATLAETISGTTSLATPGMLNMTLRQPYGVTAAIIPFNAPIMMWGAKVGAAVAAGNAIIVKTSEKAPLGPAALGRLVKEAGFPSGLIQTINGGGDTGKLLAEHMQIRKISFTGSVNTGKKVGIAAMSSNLKNVTLELGGKSPLIIFPDGDLTLAASRAATALTTLTGQACNCVTRVFCHEDVYDKFLEMYKGILSGAESWMGPVVDKIQADRVKTFLEIGKKEGTLEFGGSQFKDTGYFFQPTIFTSVPQTSRINTEEIFGPVAVVHKFQDENEVLKDANNTEFGLWANVYTKDINRALKFAKKLEAGHVSVNYDLPLAPSDMPFGGWKQSGVGRELGLKALDYWLEEKAVVVKLN